MGPPCGLFSTLEILGVDKSDGIVLKPESKTISIYRDAKQEAFTRVIIIYGSATKKIRFWMNDLNSAFLSDIAKYCTEELRELDISFLYETTKLKADMLDKFADFFEKVGPKLEHLDVGFGNDDNNAAPQWDKMPNGRHRNAASIKSLFLQDILSQYRFWSKFWSISGGISERILNNRS